MDRLRSGDLRTLLEFLRQTYAIQTIDAHAAHVVAGLPKVIPAEITGYTQADVRRRRITWSMVSEPELDLSKPRGKGINERHLEGNPVVPYHLRTGDTRAVTISDFLTRRQFHRLPLYGEWYRSVGVEYQLSVPVQTTPSALSRVSLNRDRSDFSRRERLLLDLIRPHLLQASRNAETVTKLHREGTVLQEALESRGQAVVFLGEHQKVRKATARARRLLAAYFGASRRSGACLPEILRGWTYRQQSLLHMADDAPPPREPFTVQREGSQLIVRLLSHGDEHVLLLEERRLSPDSRSLESLGLSRREADVLGWVAEGKTNEEIATILTLSRRTVEKHLENIYPKLGVENRTAAATCAHEATAGTGRLLSD